VVRFGAPLVRVVRVIQAIEVRVVRGSWLSDLVGGFVSVLRYSGIPFSLYAIDPVRPTPFVPDFVSDQGRFMTRTQTAAVSLVAAIPAGILAALLVMAFLNYSGNLKMMTQLLVGGTLLATTAVVLMPFGVLVFSGKKSAAAPAKGKAAKAADDEDEEGETLATADEILDEEPETETIVFDGSQALDTSDVDDDMEFSTDFEDEFEEEEEAPKKKGKKKR
jgi:hypothetical protein